jgi:hypothetical protein
MFSTNNDDIPILHAPPLTIANMVHPRRELVCDLHIRKMDRAPGEETSNYTRTGEWRYRSDYCTFTFVVPLYTTRPYYYLAAD